LIFMKIGKNFTSAPTFVLAVNLAEKISWNLNN
jgi:hypothetical protein